MARLGQLEHREQTSQGIVTSNCSDCSSEVAWRAPAPSSPDEFPAALIGRGRGEAPPNTGAVSAAAECGRQKNEEEGKSIYTWGRMGTTNKQAQGLKRHRPQVGLEMDEHLPATPWSAKRGVGGACTPRRSLVSQRSHQNSGPQGRRKNTRPRSGKRKQ